ncbi:uncharacterized protein LOC119740167 isoform X2 [Patiria miniata]|uniref:Uncharacterized protein n=1 Tax=Patiria miniata TaxID=46514 RepID=A0A914B4Y2_PATMI|nr:uncharacterized protein LOC119740167 isoform X2 [Patiria miniata]
MLRALIHLINAWLAATTRSSKTTTLNLHSEVIPPLSAMEGQTTPARPQQTTPATIFPTQSLEADPTVSRNVNQPMSVLLADITSLMHLSIERDDYKGPPSTFLTDLEKTVIERLKKADTVVEINRDTKGIAQDSASVWNPIEAKATVSDAQRSMDHGSNSQPVPRPRADLVSQQGAADCTITDRPLCMTFDSGISSPAEKERPVLEEDAAVTKDLHHRLQHLKAFVEAKLQDSSQPQKGATLSEEIRERLCKIAQASLASSRSENLSAPELFMEKALSGSLLVFENTKLSAEVAYLKKKVEILEDVAGTRGFSTKACTPSMESISIGSQTDELLNQPSTFDEADFGLSDFSLSPETNCLMSTALCRDGDFPQPSGMSTPGVVPNKRQRRKIEVPTQLKVTTSTSYSSINPWADADDKQQNASSVGCWRGLCACLRFYNTPHARHH